MQRLVTGLVGAFCVMGALFLGSEALFCLIIAVAATVAAHEYYRITGEGRVGLLGYVGILLTPVVPLLFFYLPYNPLYAFLSFSVITLLTVKVFRGPEKHPCRGRYKTALFGFLYISPLLSHFVILRAHENGSGAVFFVLMTVWWSDSVAYYTGRKYGVRKLAPRVSPGKSIEGSLGGTAGGILGALIVASTCFPEISLGGAVLAGALVGVSGQLGDLAESLIKREWGVKDSGSIIPGHGGLLDRLDSLFFAGPAFSLFLYVSGILSL